MCVIAVLEEMRFKINTSNPPKSICSLPCQKGQAKQYQEGEKCCWHCINCTQYQVRLCLNNLKKNNNMISDSKFVMIIKLYFFSIYNTTYEILYYYIYITY